jgi:hypothetical protein
MWRQQVPLECWYISTRLHCVSCLKIAGFKQSPINSSWRQAHWDPRPDFFFNLTLAVIVLTWHPLWREGGFVSYEYALPFVKCTYRTYSMLLKILPFALHTSPLYRLYRADLTCPMLQRQLNHLNGRKFDHRQVKASYIFYPPNTLKSHV